MRSFLFDDKLQFRWTLSMFIVHPKVLFLSSTELFSIKIYCYRLLISDLKWLFEMHSFFPLTPWKTVWNISSNYKFSWINGETCRMTESWPFTRSEYSPFVCLFFRCLVEVDLYFRWKVMQSFAILSSDGTDSISQQRHAAKRHALQRKKEKKRNTIKVPLIQCDKHGVDLNDHIFFSSLFAPFHQPCAIRW